MRFRLFICFVLVPVLPFVLAACRGQAGDSELPASYVQLALDKDDPERLLRYYFGAYAAPEGADPFRAGLLLQHEDRFYLNFDSLEARFPGAASALVDANRNQQFEWEELEPFIDGTYRRARNLPATLTEFRRAAPYETGSDEWFVVELDGVMTTARRRIFVPVDALRAALRTYHENGATLRYPAGTPIIGEHYLNGERVETTVMQRRDDGFWDFFVYGAAGTLTDSTATPPRSLKAPVQCVGCHFGNRAFEPEKSFPARAEPGPHGPRQIYVGETFRDAEVTRFFDEHRKRSDTVLGVYNTLFVARLLANRRDGSIAPEDADLLRTLGL